MKVSRLNQGLVAPVFITLCLAQGEPPPTTADPGTIKDCTWWSVAAETDTCESIAELYGITHEQLISYNPILADSCTLVVGNSYCIEQNWGEGPAPTDPSTSAVPTPTSDSPSTPTSGNGIATPTPIQPGMVDNCNKFFFVEPSTNCAAVAVQNGISQAQFFAWNPLIDTACAGLWANVYVCVGTLDGPTPMPSPTVPPGNGIPTPTPIQPGMVSNCNKFDFVETGKGCQDIANENKISLQKFYEWNPNVGSTCGGLWAEVYVCVGVVDGGGGSSPTPTTMSTSTRPGNGVATPSPIQGGMVTNCDKFHLVVAGDTCFDIAADASITLADFYKWNPAVGTSCAGLWGQYYVCISLI